MSVYKDNKTNTWRVIYRYTDWTGEQKQSSRRGFASKHEAQAWEREQMNKVTADLDMTFASFVEHYTEDLKTRLKGTGQEAVFLSAGDTLPLDGGKLTVLGPLEWDDEKENNNSLVLLAEGGGGSILLTGDMEFPEEESLLEAGMIPHADVMKVGNHGNGDATSEALIKTVSPSLAIISTNTKDKPDSPDARVMNLLKSRNIQVLMTQDTENGVLITIKGGQIQTEKK